MAKIIANYVTFYSSIMSAQGHKRLYKTIGGLKRTSRPFRVDKISKPGRWFVCRHAGIACCKDNQNQGI